MKLIPELSRRKYPFKVKSPLTRIFLTQNVVVLKIS